MADDRPLEQLWYGDATGAAAARVALLPLSLLYRGATAMRNAAYDAGVFSSEDPALPCVSVGNLTVGGTGKTPISAWIARRLLDAGAHPAIVLRGYGDDEPLVHARLNPNVPVIVAPDRLAGVKTASTRGADVAVLDDAFQHRRARRVADLVLISAERWSDRPRMLPAGPWREPMAALSRATTVIVTRKIADAARAELVADSVRRLQPTLPIAIAHLALDALESADGSATRSIADLSEQRVLAIAAIADPSAFGEQLERQGARVELHALPDHHAFSDTEIASLAARASAADFVVSTLKDAVKLAPRWPRAAPTLWYVSQRIFVERGGAALDAALAAVLGARRSKS
ncbi:MAG: tetraacyldisaccharide 4'-kinase [Gemmatimonadota bacterium]|nr:tetraacyldisaccharide 4'-kinase [Gemmatimonadota bacterium]